MNVNQPSALAPLAGAPLANASAKAAAVPAAFAAALQGAMPPSAQPAISVATTANARVQQALAAMAAGSGAEVAARQFGVTTADISNAGIDTSPELRALLQGATYVFRQQYAQDVASGLAERYGIEVRPSARQQDLENYFGDWIRTQSVLNEPQRYNLPAGGADYLQFNGFGQLVPVRVLDSIEGLGDYLVDYDAGPNDPKHLTLQQYEAKYGQIAQVGWGAASDPRFLPGGEFETIGRKEQRVSYIFLDRQAVGGRSAPEFADLATLDEYSENGFGALEPGETILQSGRLGLSIAEPGRNRPFSSPENVYYLDERGLVAAQSGFNAPDILRNTAAYGIDLADLRGLGEQLDGLGVGYRPYLMLPGTGSDHGIDIDDLIAGGLGTAYDWRVDSLPADQALAAELGVVANPAVTPSAMRPNPAPSATAPATAGAAPVTSPADEVLALIAARPTGSAAGNAPVVSMGAPTAAAETAAPARATATDPAALLEQLRALLLSLTPAERERALDQALRDLMATRDTA